MKIGLPEVLKYLRRDTNLTQKQLAKETGLSLSAIVSYENGLREPNSKAMATLESYFGVSGEYLRGDIDQKTFRENSETINNQLDSLSVLMEQYKDAFTYAAQDRKILATGVLEETIFYITNHILKDEEAPFLTVDKYRELLECLKELNSNGQDELVKRAYELTQIKAYKSHKRNPDKNRKND